MSPIHFESKAVANASLNITEEDRIIITIDYLNYCASNDKSLRDKDFLYTLKSLPMQGSLVLNGKILRSGSSFNQQDLRNGSLIYVYDHGINIMEIDSFRYSFSVVNRTTDEVTFQLEIHILSVDQDHSINLTPNAQIDVTPSPTHAITETALSRLLSQTPSSSILIGTMVPAFVITAAGVILLTIGVAVIVLRHHHNQKYPVDDHIYDYPNNQQPPVLPAPRNKLEAVTESPQIDRQKNEIDGGCSTADVGKTCVLSNNNVDESSSTGVVADEVECNEVRRDDSSGISLQENEAYKLHRQSPYQSRFDTPSAVHPIEGPDIDQAVLAQEESLQIQITKTATEIDAPQNCNFSSSCVGIVTTSVSSSSIHVATQNEALVSVCRDKLNNLGDVSEDVRKSAACDSTPLPESCLKCPPCTYDLKPSGEVSAECNDSMKESGTNIETPTQCRDAHQCNSYEHICGYERI